MSTPTFTVIYEQPPAMAHGPGAPGLPKDPVCALVSTQAPKM